RLYGPVTARHMDASQVRDPLFPGLVPLALGVVGLASAPRRFRAVSLVASALALILSLGPETGFYRFLHEHVVLFRGIRALSRFSLVPVLALAVLSGLAPAARWLAGRPGAVVDLPIGPERDTDVMLDGLAHRRPLLNGDSGFVPRAY